MKPGHRVVLLGVDDPGFVAELHQRDADVGTRLRKNTDVVFLQIASFAGLGRLKAARAALVPAGSIWVLWPKGRRELTEDHIRAAALALRLVDVKVVAFSDVLSGLKLVIPLAHRPK